MDAEEELVFNSMPDVLGHNSRDETCCGNVSPALTAENVYDPTCVRNEIKDVIHKPDNSTVVMQQDNSTIVMNHQMDILSM